MVLRRGKGRGAGISQEFFTSSAQIPFPQVEFGKILVFYILAFFSSQFRKYDSKNPKVIEDLRQVPKTKGSFQTVLKRASGEIMVIN